MDIVQIKNRINQILADDRFNSKTALVEVNAPLALIQYGLQVELHTLQKILGYNLTDVSKIRNE